MAVTKRSREEWVLLVAEQEASGESPAAFSAKRGLTLKTFQRWKRRCGEPMTLVPVASSPVPTPSSIVRVDLGTEISLQFSADAASPALGRCLATLIRGLRS